MRLFLQRIMPLYRRRNGKGLQNSTQLSLGKRVHFADKMEGLPRISYAIGAKIDDFLPRCIDFCQYTNENACATRQ